MTKLPQELEKKDYIVFVFALPFLLVGGLTFFVWHNLRIGWSAAEFLWEKYA